MTDNITEKNKNTAPKSKRDVAAGLIMCDGLLLIAQRKHGKNLEYKWEFPGGKLEEGETLEECLRREMMEEMQLEVFVREPFVTSSYDYDFGTIVLHSFWATCKSKDIPVVLEHEQYKWVDPHELPQYDFAPADKPIIEAIMGLL
ncbi:MAG: (deoxy)nucleoside triphosphate pyrophosphohydrolase [Alphaproteobacteria bacterium]|nr:(deoxy)nucleoside triphosphate pyrophosphohydrolase [Alphaproteobacteria bacterium]